MAAELWVTLIVGGIAVITIVALINHGLDQARMRRLRTLATTSLFLQQCWTQISAIPSIYLPAELRQLFAKVMRSRLQKALRIDPGNSHLRDQAVQIEQLASSHATTEPPRLNPERRREIRRGLLGLKRVCIEAGVQGVLSKDDAQRAEVVINALARRILIDHLVNSGTNAENLRSFEESLAFFERALEEAVKLPGSQATEEVRRLEVRVEELRKKRDEHQNTIAQQAEAALARNWAQHDDLSRPPRFDI